jgi:hypothetical protein
MRKWIATKLWIGLPVLLWVAHVPSASAYVIGHLSVANCAGGGVTVSAATIDWLTGSPMACLQVGALTNITSVGDGSLNPSSPNGTINDIPPNSGINGFMSFVSAAPFINLQFNLDAIGGFGPGVGTTCATNPGLGNSCSVGPLPGGQPSPFILTQTGTGTTVTLLAKGTITDVGGQVSNWNGAFTTQINGLLPSAIQTTILSGGSITSTFSGEFDVSAVPEPGTLAMIGFGLIGVASLRRRKKNA